MVVVSKKMKNKMLLNDGTKNIRLMKSKKEEVREREMIGSIFFYFSLSLFLSLFVRWHDSDLEGRKARKRNEAMVALKISLRPHRQE